MNEMRRTPVPPGALLPAAAGVLLILLPVAAIVLSVQWRELPAQLSSASAQAALLLSVRTALAATGTCLVLGVPLALVLSRADFPGKGLVRSLVLLPIVLPPVVGGIALLKTFGRQGLLGNVLELLGIQVAYSTVAVTLAQTFVSLPFVVLAVESAVRTVDLEILEAAMVDGAGPTMALRRIVLPLIAPGLMTGAILAFARSLGEFGATIAFAGSLEGVTRTLPLEIYLRRETDPEAAVALSLLLVAVALIVVGLTTSRRSRGDTTR